MKILLISDEYNDIPLRDILNKKLFEAFSSKQNDFKSYLVKEEDLKPCIGCFSCWLKTPGLCVIKDLGRDISRDILNCDLLIIVSKIAFGCYSPAIKRILDRHIPSILPFLKIVNGEMHHSSRYNKYPEIVVLGYGEDVTIEEEKTLNQLADANAVNLQKKKAKTYICRSEKEIDSIMKVVFVHIENMGGKFNG
ncbi:NADPH-dependent FMN reductase [Clostridium pasteurianum DSM 525 = ATCC 6013]|uniref:NADPH-dependent FMN reductase n=1 Tax=Clostridium pasteurianum DSM 525 = ATCC 6013 TaxID=1262449 RepID=A0A0H3J7L5_CLOPA|nr:NAD(P)H-dependent oxidoreductase [Clostridium pasteurianum]AJA46990.1 NADPH-dependent FMN reductase [Clostridium pasteurianum DSM 525 = ATCC 6013]AJA50978.1 NADPH-dependent FMN reductase [Clostridium pasteurianum DSM 525 = ATCC 6013]AOZ74367.1 hypothetical protein AQ983_04315 [Clostridium pasteurianum DSM 525 = ATCC 6013]AOZ78165.1 hypothetical protein AQ984_04320 [Clostridium pasteurianum]ELP58241.1 hypothetical protein F502_16105 [Clostridium pasteurianum DSM 525 = ATCC 6013]